MPTTLRDKRTGKTLVTDKPLDALQSGQFEGDPNVRYSAISPAGEAVSFGGEGLAEAVAKGYKLETPEERAERKERREYGGTAGELKAGAAGAARGLTFGLSDVALTKSGAVNPATLERLKRHNPEASAAGEIAGVAGGLVLPIGWAGAGVRGAAAAGGLASRLAGRAIGAAGADAAGGLAARALAKGVQSGVGSAVEGALYGAGQGISEAALGDPEDAASKLIAHTGMGALFGGVFGAGAGVLGAVGSRALEKMGDLASGARRSLAGATEATGDVLSNATPTRQGRGAQRFLEDLSGEQALDAAGLMKRDYRQLQRAVKQLEGVGDTEGAAEARELVSLHSEAGRIMRERGLAKAGDNLADVGQRVQREIQTARARAGKLVQQADAKADVPLFDLKGYADDLRKMASEFEGRPELQSEYDSIMRRADAYDRMPADLQTRAAKLRAKAQDVADDRRQFETLMTEAEEIDRMGQSGKISLKYAESLKRDFDDAFVGAGSGAAKRLARQSRGQFNARIEAAAKETMSPADFTAWKEAKRTQEALIPVAKANADRLAAMQSNRKVSLTSYMTGLGTLGAMGANPAGAAAGLVATGLHKLVLERGSAAVSDYAQRAAMALGGVGGARSLQLLHMERSAGQVTTTINKTIEQMGKALERTPALGAPAGVKSMHEILLAPKERQRAAEAEDAYTQRLTEIAHLANDPALLQRRLEASLGDLTRWAPRVSAEVHLSATRAIQYLAKVAPTNPYLSAPSDIRKAWRPTASEVARFERTIRAVNDPLGTVKDFASGRTSKEAADALREVYPGIYRQVVEGIVPKIAQAKHVPLQRRLEMADLLGVSLDAITSPQLRRTLQQNYQQAATPAPRPSVAKNARATQIQTPLQRALGGA